jgi:hypothetical protein
VVDVRGLRQVGWAVGELPRRRGIAAEAGEGLVDGRRLDDPVVGKLLSSRRGDGEAGRRSFSARGLWGLDGPSKGTRLTVAGGVVFRAGSLAAVLLARLDDLPLALSDVQTALELLAHGGVLGVEARR